MLNVAIQQFTLGNVKMTLWTDGSMFTATGRR